MVWAVEGHELVIAFVASKYLTIETSEMTRWGETDTLSLEHGEYRVTCIGYEQKKLSNNPDKVRVIRQKGGTLMKRVTRICCTLAVAVVSFGVSVSVASAQVWPETGDAGKLPASAQRPVGIGSLVTITGNLTFGDPDMYEIYLTGDATFSALAQGTPPTFLLNPQLYLFNSLGVGVYANEDLWPPNPFFAPGASLLPADHPLTPLAPGRYFLAISTRYIEPVSAQGAIFPCVGCNSTVVAQGPTGPGGAYPVSGWSGFGFTAGTYTISLTGAEFVASVESVQSLLSSLNDEVMLLTSYGQRSLVNKLSVTSQMLDGEQFCAAMQMLEAFQREVSGLANAGRISDADVGVLLNGASAAISAVQAIVRQSSLPDRC